MKTLRYRIGSEVKPGILDADENIRDASSLVKDWDAENIIVEKLNELKSRDISSLNIVQNHDKYKYLHSYNPYYPRMRT